MGFLRSRKSFGDMAVIILGGAVMALGIDLFFEPHHIVPGGLTGVAMMLNYIFPALPIGVTVLALNVPLFVIGWRKLGVGFLTYTMVGTVSSSLFIDVFARIPAPGCDPLAASVFGGALTGIGIGLVFSRGATTGGTDMLARLLKLAFPATQMGVLMLVVDGVVVFASIFVFGSLNTAFFAIVGLYLSSQLTDLILYGVNVQWTAHIVSDRWAEINDSIQHDLERGATLLQAEGGYSGMPRTVILCAVKRQQIASLKSIVKSIDPQAFIIVNKAYDVLGEGFREYDKNSV